MGVCDAVKALAEAISKSKAPSEPRHRLQIEILRLMPLYFAISDLPGWESAFQQVFEEQGDESELEELIWAVFDFGRYNMYSAFKPNGTKDEFTALAASFKQCGVEVSLAQDLTCW